MAKAKIETIKVTEPPKIPTLSFRGKPSIFPGGRGPGGGPKAAFMPKIRITQSKGAGSGK